MFVLFYIQLFSYLLCKYVIKRSVQFRSNASNDVVLSCYLRPIASPVSLAGKQSYCSQWIVLVLFINR